VSEAVGSIADKKRVPWQVILLMMWCRMLVPLGNISLVIHTMPLLLARQLISMANTSDNEDTQIQFHWP
jgi:hypothetical protein